MTTALDLSQEQWSSYSLATTRTIRADQERWERGWQLTECLAFAAFVEHKAQIEIPRN